MLQTILPMTTGVVKIGQSLSADRYREIIFPFIVKCFGSQDRGVRYRLLGALGDFVEHLDESTAASKIFPELCNGFHDQNNAIREASIKALVPLCASGKLPKALVQDKVAKILLRCLGDREAALRTNACICFGKIAPNMENPSPVLTQAFAHALKVIFRFVKCNA